MLTAVICAPSLAQMMEQVQQASHQAQALELRFDALEELDTAAITDFYQNITLPSIVTVRKQSHGGHWQDTEEARMVLIKSLMHLQPDFCDLEVDVPLIEAEAIQSLSPNTKFIRSYHNFEAAPVDLKKIFNNMQADMFAIYKIVTTAQSSLDTLAMLNFVQQKSAHTALVGHCMGELGMPGRILGPVVGNYFTYASVDDTEAAPGMLSLETLVGRYRVNSLNKDTHIYGLIGDPVNKSQGHITWNKRFADENKNAVYVKINLQQAELAKFLQTVASLPFYGLSVTMPHKSNVIPFLADKSPVAETCQAVNTLIKQSDGWEGDNTDGVGALDAIEASMPVAGKKVIILGAGGSAKAIAFEARQRGADIHICNRTLDNAEKIAEKLNGEASKLSDIAELVSKPFNILINTIPQDANGEYPWLAELAPRLTKAHAVMDINYHPRSTPLTACAEQAGSPVIYGDAMFTNQAEQQNKLWAHA